MGRHGLAASAGRNEDKDLAHDCGRTSSAFKRHGGLENYHISRILLICLFLLAHLRKLQNGDRSD